MKIVIDGKEVVIPSGGSPFRDSTPIGTVISFLGTTAPKGYLVCDGAEYLIADHSALADFFRQQFGTSNYFGGDGETTFAVPDMRNLFLRGYHGDAEEKLSRDVGEKQEGTRHANILRGGTGDYTNDYLVAPKVTSSDLTEVIASTDRDTTIGTSDIMSIWETSAYNDHYASEYRFKQYTSRPVNMAVLYCIKAEKDVTNSSGGGSLKVYSTEEIRIGTWIDDKPFYRVVLQCTSPSAANTEEIICDTTALNIETLCLLDGIVNNSPVNWYRDSTHYFATRLIVGSGIQMIVGHPTYTNVPVRITLEYTKTTDQPEN